MTGPTTAIVVSYHTGQSLKECLYALAADPVVDAVRRPGVYCHGDE